ncbi:MAG: TlpA family protein disulfide reductase [Gammaproteobacteria bacterium]|nr:TlpA family protein disulfide reductase [Gammaproteobacteria bacterium]
MLHRSLVLLLVGMMWSMTASAGPLEFVSGTMHKIRAHYHGKPYVLVIWSLDCAYCFDELRELGDMLKRQPALPLVLLSVDDISLGNNAAELLARTGLASLPAYMFADSFVERLRYEIDPLWHGELPRNYLVSANGERTAITGPLGADRLVRWLSEQSGHERTASPR